MWDAIEQVYVLEPQQRTVSNFANIIGELKERLHRRLFIKNETIRSYIVQAQKAWRKHHAAMILPTQSIKELEESGMLQIVSESCPTKIFLANPEMDRDLYREAFHLNDTELELIAGLVPPGQMLIRKAQSSKKVHLNVDSVTHWTAAKKIMEAATGDKDFWVVDVVGNFCFVHPAKAGISSNLNIITDKGNI
jgi:hypothetical protein